MLDVLDKHKLIGGKGMNTLTYLENTDEDFNEGELIGVESNNGVLQPIARIDDKCELLIKGSLPCVDTSPNPKPITSVTSTYTDDEEGSTLRFASGEYIKLNQDIDIAKGEDFTLEFRLKRIDNNYSANRWIMSDVGNSGDIKIQLCGTNATFTLVIKSLVLNIANIPNYIVEGKWYTLAIQRYNSIVSVWLDNNCMCTSTKFDDAFSIKSGTHFMSWREAYTTHYSNCYFKELLLTRKALYPQGANLRLSPNIKKPNNLLSAKCDWEGEGKITINNHIKFEGNDKNTVLLIRDDFKDISSYNKVLTPSNTTISNEGKFTKSINLANTSTIKITEGFKNVDLSKDFTIDWWEYSTGTSVANGALLTNRSNLTSNYARGLLLGYGGTTIYAGTSSTTTAWNIFNAITFKDKVDNEWVHWAFVKKGTTWTTYRNGVKFWSTTNSSIIGQTDEYNITLGAWVDNSNFNAGYNALISEFRVSDVARWTKDFAPPNFPYIEDVITNLPLEKGKTITSLPSNFQLKQEIEREETISNVSLEMKYKVEDKYTVPKVEGEENSNVLYLYKSGDPEGKMVRYIYGGTSTNSCAFESDKINTYVPSGAIGLGVRTSEMIDLTPYSKIYLEGQNVTGNTCNFIISKNATIIPSGIGLGHINSSSRTLLEVDISKYNDTYYIGQYQNGDGGVRRNYIYNIWLEK